MVRGLLAGLLLISSSAFGEEYRAFDGPFTAVVFISDNPQRIYSDWLTNPSPVIKIQSLPSVSAGKAIEAILVFSGCTPDSKGNCTVEADWTVTTPSGELIGKTENEPIWGNRTAPAAGQLQIAEKGLSIVSASRHEGYVFKVKVRDKVSGRSVEIMQRIKVVGT
jgi:hypothetical protein